MVRYLLKKKICAHKGTCCVVRTSPLARTCVTISTYKVVGYLGSELHRLAGRLSTQVDFSISSWPQMTVSVMKRRTHIVLLILE